MVSICDIIEPSMVYSSHLVSNSLLNCLMVAMRKNEKKHGIIVKFEI